MCIHLLYCLHHITLILIDRVFSLFFLFFLSLISLDYSEFPTFWCFEFEISQKNKQRQDIFWIAVKLKKYFQPPTLPKKETYTLELGKWYNLQLVSKICEMEKTWPFNLSGQQPNKRSGFTVTPFSYFTPFFPLMFICLFYCVML